jgi:hypothetical protein
VTERGEDLLDETTLRRALRLEADERGPLFDAATIAAAARQRPRLAIVSALVALALGVVGAVTVWSAVVIFLPTVVATVFDAGLTIFALLAGPATGTLELAQQPAVPLSLLVALAIASAHELRERRQTVASAR